MRYERGSRRRRLLVPVVGGTCAAVLLAGAVTAVVAGERPAAAAGEVVARPASGIWTVEGRGFGHGRGMSQWGARAAAVQGRTAEQILRFYYPGTVRKGIGNPPVRVRIGAEEDLVLAPAAGLRVSWRGGAVRLPVAPRIDRWQLAARAGGIGLRHHDPTGWRWWGRVLPASVDVAATRPVLRVHKRDGTSIDYRSLLTVTRSGAGLVTVNRLPMQAYLAGVVPRESPASWPMQALRAQAVAARTYAYARMRRNVSALYDICDTTACQVYGGAARYRANGRRLSGEQKSTNAAVRSTAGVVLLSGGRPATTEYSASHGGWSAPGGVPYLVARRDPYTAGDPHRIWRKPVRVADVGRRFGFARLDRVRMVRDGHGDWGGRVRSVELTGLDGVGKPRAVTVSGTALRSALGVKSTYFRLLPG